MEEENINDKGQDQNEFVESVKNLYCYRNKLHKLPACVRNRRYKKLQQVYFFYMFVTINFLS